jgi:LCP family protein required for cell wall assembly
MKEHTDEQKFNRKKRILVIVGILATTIVVAAAAFFGFDNSKDKAEPAMQVSTHKKINILLLGIDERKNDIGRSNVTCVVSIDPDTKSVSMLWVPRDSRVKIPDHGWNKIGHAYAYGGPKLSEQTVADLLGIPIDYYISINMDGFKKVIDALGGVDINVEKRMYYYDPYDEGEVDNDGLIDLKPGLQHMDGNIALEYVRFRHDEMGDIGRIERQQKFAKALLEDVMTPSAITKVPGVLKEANSVFATDMPMTEMLSLTTVITNAYKNGLKTDMVAGKPVYIDEISYWVPDIVAMRKQIAQIQGITINDQYLAAAQSLATEYEASMPKADAPELAKPADANKQNLVTSQHSTTKNNPQSDTTSSTAITNGKSAASTPTKVPKNNSDNSIVAEPATPTRKGVTADTGKNLNN